jgi:hypothetical protein
VTAKFSRVFLLSPARIGGRRSDTLLRDEAQFELAVRLRQGAATIAEIYAFISGLYFRGKVAYAEAFGASPEGVPPAVAIVPGEGLVPLNTIYNHQQLQAIGRVSIEDTDRFTQPLLRDASKLDSLAGPDCRYVLLGSIATEKYTSPLLSLFGERLIFPSEFVGRGDMSRGGLMLRCAYEGQELTYVPVEGAIRRGKRPPKLEPLRNR